MENCASTGILPVLGVGYILGCGVLARYQHPCSKKKDGKVLYVHFIRLFMLVKRKSRHGEYYYR